MKKLDIKPLIHNKQFLQLLLFTACALLAFVSISGSTSMKNTAMPVEIVHLITAETIPSFSFTTYTTGATTDTQYCKINTLNRPIVIHFLIQNTTNQLNPYFTTLTVTVRLKSTTGTFDKTTTTTFNGSTANEGTITVVSNYNTYNTLVHVNYETKGLAGQKKIILSIWAVDG